VLRETCLLLTKKNNKKYYSDFLTLLIDFMKDIIDKNKKEDNYKNKSLIINYLLFILTLTINLKDYPIFIKTLFKKYFKIILSLIKEIKNEKINNTLLDLLSGLFLEEYKSIYFRKEQDKELEDLYINKEIEITKIYFDAINSYQKETYNKIFYLLFEFNLNYDTIYNNYLNAISSEEKPIFKTNLIQSILRLLFYPEKRKYFAESKYYEYDLLKKIIDKNMKETLKLNGDEYKTVFRKDDICDDIIKYLFFMFGNTTMIEAFFNPLKKMMKKLGIIMKKNDNKTKKKYSNERNITQKEFELFFDEMIEGFRKHLPYILKIILKIIYTSVRKHFTIEKDNYRPLNTALIFNFIVNPRIQSLYSVNPSKYKFIRTLNRLLCNTCFNTPFIEKDELSRFNKCIESNNLKLKNFFQKFIISIDEEKEEEKNKIKNIFNEKFSIYPKFFFIWDSKFFYTSINEKMEKIMNFGKETSYINNLSESKNNINNK
jgi:hypothetical protein